MEPEVAPFEIEVEDDPVQEADPNEDPVQETDLVRLKYRPSYLLFGRRPPRQWRVWSLRSTNRRAGCGASNYWWTSPQGISYAKWPRSAHPYYRPLPTNPRTDPNLAPIKRPQVGKYLMDYFQIDVLYSQQYFRLVATTFNAELGDLMPFFWQRNFFFSPAPTFFVCRGIRRLRYASTQVEL